MTRTERIFRLHALLRVGKAVSRKKLQDALEMSRATVTRDIEYMRDFMGAPIVYEHAANGYRYDATASQFELPGLWFNASELHALLACERLLEEVQPGLLAPQLTPLKKRIESILESQHVGGGEITKRVRILRSTARHASDAHFQVVADALLRRQDIHIRYRDRARDQATERKISPQRLIHYRDNWYLDAWCHLRQALRTFSLDRIQTASILDRAAREIGDEELDAYFTHAYGIFSGSGNEAAVLRFTPERTRWVADEQWHPAQQGQWLDDGHYQLTVPYSDPRELIMDILKYGPDVEVIAPESLRKEVAERLARAAAQY